jgi:hypothetical protein
MPGAPSLTRSLRQGWETKPSRTFLAQNMALPANNRISEHLPPYMIVSNYVQRQPCLRSKMSGMSPVRTPYLGTPLPPYFL